MALAPPLSPGAFGSPTLPARASLAIPSGPSRLDEPLHKLPRSCVNGIPIDRVSMEDAASWVIRALKSSAPRRPLLIMGPNAQLVTLAARQPRFAAALRSADLSVPDGISVVLAARLLGQPVPERVTGGELMERLCIECAQHNLSVFFLGGLPEAAEKTARKFQRNYPGFRLAGTCCPPLVLKRIPSNLPAFAVRLRPRNPICSASPSALRNKSYGWSRTAPHSPLAQPSLWARLLIPRPDSASAHPNGPTASGVNGSTA